MKRRLQWGRSFKRESSTECAVKMGAFGRLRGLRRERGGCFRESFIRRMGAFGKNTSEG